MDCAGDHTVTVFLVRERNHGELCSAELNDVVGDNPFLRQDAAVNPLLLLKQSVPVGDVSIEGPAAAVYIQYRSVEVFPP